MEERSKLNGNIERAKSIRIRNSQRAKYNNKDKEANQSMQQDKRKWADDLASEAEKAARSKLMTKAEP